MTKLYPSVSRQHKEDLRIVDQPQSLDRYPVKNRPLSFPYPPYRIGREAQAEIRGGTLGDHLQWFLTIIEESGDPEVQVVADPVAQLIDDPEARIIIDHEARVTIDPEAQVIRMQKPITIPGATVTDQEVPVMAQGFQLTMNVPKVQRITDYVAPEAQVMHRIDLGVLVVLALRREG